MTHQIYKHWSKSSIYLKAVIDGKLLCGISTFYKYCSLFGFENKSRRKRSDDPVKISKPNELWCVDVTIFKTKDHIKHYTVRQALEKVSQIDTFSNCTDNW